MMYRLQNIRVAGDASRRIDLWIDFLLRCWFDVSLIFGPPIQKK